MRWGIRRVRLQWRLIGMASKLPAANLTAMYFVGTISNAQQTCGSIGRRQSIVVGNPRATKRLDGIVDHPTCHIRYSDFDHSDLCSRGLVANSIHHMCGLQCQQSRLLDKDARFRNPHKSHTALCDGFAERDPVLGAETHSFQCALGQADQAHAMMDASWP
jgi:hypothetical protein